jgi:hypothetical protein
VKRSVVNRFRPSGSSVRLGRLLLVEIASQVLAVSGIRGAAQPRLATVPSQSDSPSTAEAPYCERCGRSLRPLGVPHVERPCSECGRSVYLVEPGEGGGIQIRAGDKFTIPAGWLTMSLDPAKSRGRFFRHGVSWYVRQLFTADLPTETPDVDGYLERYYEQAGKVLETSPKLAHLDLDSESGAHAAQELIEDGSAEWWAMHMGVAVLNVREAVKAGSVEQALVWTARLQASHSMLVYVKHLDEHVWTGYRHMQQVYDIASAAARTPREAELIQALRPAFSQLSEDVLHAWVESGVPIGPRIGITELEESLVRELARFHLNEFDRRRRDEQMAAERRERAWVNRREGAVAMAVIATGVVGILKSIGVL